MHWDTEFRADAQEIRSSSAAPVIQPSQDMLSRQEQMSLVKQANDELTIRHTAVLPDQVVAQVEAPAKSLKQQQYEAEMQNKMFPRFHDDEKDMGDSRITSDNLKVLGV